MLVRPLQSFPATWLVEARKNSNIRALEHHLRTVNQIWCVGMSRLTFDCNVIISQSEWRLVLYEPISLSKGVVFCGWQSTVVVSLCRSVQAFWPHSIARSTFSLTNFSKCQARIRSNICVLRTKLPCSNVQKRSTLKSGFGYQTKRKAIWPLLLPQLKVIC